MNRSLEDTDDVLGFGICFLGPSKGIKFALLGSS